MVLELIKRIPKGAVPMTAAELDANWTSIESEVNNRPTILEMNTGLAGKLGTSDPAVTNARAIKDGTYTFFSVTSGITALIAATAVEAKSGTVGKPIDAFRLQSMHSFTNIASSAGTLTLDWSNIPSLGVVVDVGENINSIVVSNILDYPVSVLFRITGSFTVTVPAHNATVSGRTFKRMDGDVWPSLPNTVGGRFFLNMRKIENEIYASLGGICTS